MARTFGGVSDQIAFGSEAALDDLSPYTAMALVRTTGDVTDERILLSKFTSGYVGTIHLGATGGGGNNNKIYTYVSGSTPWYAESAVNAMRRSADAAGKELQAKIDAIPVRQELSQEDKDALQHAGIIDDDMRIVVGSEASVYEKGVRRTVAVLRPITAEAHAASVAAVPSTYGHG